MYLGAAQISRTSSVADRIRSTITPETVAGVQEALARAGLLNTPPPPPPPPETGMSPWVWVGLGLGGLYLFSKMRGR